MRLFIKPHRTSPNLTSFILLSFEGEEEGMEEYALAVFRGEKK
jgi:hypothetical protein